jgi:hypothetical protein
MISMEELQAKRSFSGWMGNFLQESPSWLVSMLFHMVLILVLAMWTISNEAPPAATSFVITRDSAQKIEEVEPALDEVPKDVNLKLDAAPGDPLTGDIKTDMNVGLSNLAPDNAVPGVGNDLDAARGSVAWSDIGTERAPRSDLLNRIGTFNGTGLTGRGKLSGHRLKGEGGTTGSQRAVELALQWLAAHQMPDGGWSFNLGAVPSCRGQCRNSGSTAQARIAATGMALMVFLGNGQTHKEGRYQKVVKNGLYFLTMHMRVSPQGGRLDEPEAGGMMYSHGIASIALCEAYAMTHDKGLQMPAQSAINFICYAQDPVGGGWRYMPQQKGDTSVMGWQIMALKSGHMAYLNVPALTVKKAYEFLDYVQSNSGANYGYTEPGSPDLPREGTTAVGLLCRMYLGWKKDNPGLQGGIEYLARIGPSETNMYYDYYATQVMHHWQGKEWDKWNKKMRDYLIMTQAKMGHEQGSWFFPGGDPGAGPGGRLYITVLAAMTLEVYYRYMPLYRTKSMEDDFPM